MKSKSKSSKSSSSKADSERELPIGICETRFYNPEHREKKDPKSARPCFYAYIGGKKRYRAKRFMIDTLGREKALREAKKWRREQEREMAALNAQAGPASQPAKKSATKPAAKSSRKAAR